MIFRAGRTGLYKSLWLHSFMIRWLSSQNRRLNTEFVSDLPFIVLCAAENVQFWPIVFHLVLLATRDFSLTELVRVLIS